MQVSMTDARRKWYELVRLAENGERIIMCRDGIPVAVMRPTTLRTKKPAKKKRNTRHPKK